MSAAPERMSGKRRAIRIRRFHVYKNRKNIMEEILKSGAFLPFPNAWRPLVFQKSRGNTQTALIFTIFAYTYGRQREKGEKIPLWNWNKMPDCPWGPPLQATDIADENSLSDREIRDDIEDAIDRGLMERKGDVGEDYSRYRLLPKNWFKVSRPFKPRNPTGAGGPGGKRGNAAQCRGTAETAPLRRAGFYFGLALASDSKIRSSYAGDWRRKGEGYGIANPNSVPPATGPRGGRSLRASTGLSRNHLS